MSKITGFNSLNRNSYREISAIQSKPITTQGYSILHSSEAVTGGREFLDSLSNSEAVQLDKSGVKIMGVAFDYDFNSGEWAI